MSFDEWISSFGLERLRLLAEEGCSEEVIAERSGVSIQTFRKWKKQHPEVSDALALGRRDADFRVISALYKKATGFNVELRTTYKLKRVEFDPDTGKKLCEYEELATGIDETYVPADLSAEKFWLENRQGEKWCRVIGEGDGDGEHGVLVMPEADMIDEIESADELSGEKERSYD